MSSNNSAKLKWDAALYQESALKIRAEKELRAEYSRLRDIAQKRLSRLRESEFADSESYRHYKDMFPKLEAVKTNYELRARLSELARFVENKTSTVSGLKEKRSKQLATIQEDYPWVNESNFQQFYEFAESYSSSRGGYYSVPELKEAYEEQFGKVDSDDLKAEFEKEQKMNPRIRRKSMKSSSDYEQAMSPNSRRTQRRRASNSRRRR